MSGSRSEEDERESARKGWRERVKEEEEEEEKKERSRRSRRSRR